MPIITHTQTYDEQRPHSFHKPTHTHTCSEHDKQYNYMKPSKTNNYNLDRDNTHLTNAYTHMQ